MLDEPSFPYDEFTKRFIMKHLVDLILNYLELHVEMVAFICFWSMNSYNIYFIFVIICFWSFTIVFVLVYQWIAKTIPSSRKVSHMSRLLVNSLILIIGIGYVIIIMSYHSLCNAETTMFVNYIFLNQVYFFFFVKQNSLFWLSVLMKKIEEWLNISQAIA